ncbi:hypothetical protein V2U94_15295 [Paenibacillus polymyxa]|uniref:hypothetical protein n=1 Tax=Paenibacillus polymyxa TaxID=1406 RepID=UPI002ED352A5|nr:hypothetical protein [Paenibacillus polymyxa]
MNFKKLLILFSTLFIIFTGALPSSTYANGEPQTGSQTVLDSFAIEDLDKYPDVKDYISKKGFDSYLKDEAQTNDIVEPSPFKFSAIQIQPNAERSAVTFSTYGEIPNLSGVTSSTYGETLNISEELTPEKEDAIAEKYGLTKPETRVLNHSQNILVQRNMVTNSIVNVWMLNYVYTNSDFTITIMNTGTDPIDSISGTLKKYNKSRDTWKLGATRKFNKVAVKTGIVYKWATGREAVSDYFEYQISVNDNGTVVNYDNIGKTTYQRYYFRAGAYNLITAFGGERHHFVANQSLTATGFNANKAPAVRMLYRDHLNTPSWGSSASAIAFRDNEQSLLRNKQYEDLIRLEVSGLKGAADSEGKFPNLEQKYYYELVDAILLTEKYFGIK